MAYKVFISYKNSDSNGNRTQESKLAENLYSLLMARGIEVFYSNRSLLDFGEAAYKLAIEKALDEAENLIVMASSVENLTSSWVSYEWNSLHEDILAGDEAYWKARIYEIATFLGKMKNGREKMLLYYRYVKGESVEHCGELLGVSRSTVFRMKHRALALAVLVKKRIDGASFL